MTKREIINEIKPILEELSYSDAVSYLTQNDKKWLKEIIKVLEQEPTEWQHDHAILKAYSDGANEMRDEIRAEVESLNVWSLRYAPAKDKDMRPQIVTNVKNHVLEIIDKYREE